MSGWDAGTVSSANLGLRVDDAGFPSDASSSRILKTEAQSKFRQFLKTFRDTNQTFPYRDELKANVLQEQYYLPVSMEDLRGFDVQLNSLLAESPQEYIPVFEAAAKEVASSLLGSDVPLSHDIQIQLRSFPRITPLRQLSAEHVSRLVTIRGIVVSASRPRIKATTIQIMCRNCKVTKQVACGTGFGGARLPRECDTRPMDAAMPKCPLDPYMIVADNTEYIDQQRLKLQENPEAIPTGEMPRHVMLAAERYLVGTVKPGTRITVIGQYTTYEAHSASEQSKTGTSDVGIRIPYVRVLGVEPENDAADIMVGRWEPQDEEEMHQLAARHDIYKQIANSLAPAIYGSEDIKKALACQLFGGSRKRLPDGMRLRGDVNVLLLGDPSVAKSQFLKFVSQVAPIAVYTSGKGSSAAGLTASVIRDAGSGEFHLEGGALVLADGGLVCIDEFDKMREQDRVAIHEAMEQQTISIAKAGITTILNSRTSVLAAANPIFGRYDDMKTPTENIDFQTTILSRFDLIFIVRDVQDMKRDQQLAKYIINVHRNPNAAVQNVKDKEGLIEIDVLKKYVAYARSRCQPRLSDEAAVMLKNQYVSFRKEMATRRAEGHGSVIPITVRQLEAIVRLSESLARMHLSEVATVEHVEEAIRLFKVSTFQAATANVGEGPMRPDFYRMVQKVEAQLDLRVSVGMTVHTRRIVEELKARFGDENVINKAIQNKVSNMSYKFKAQQKQLTRIK